MGVLCGFVWLLFVFQVVLFFSFFFFLFGFAFKKMFQDLEEVNTIFLRNVNLWIGTRAFRH